LQTYLYRSASGLKTGIGLEEIAEEIGREDSSFWIDISGEDFEEDLKKVAEVLGLHPLSVEDALTPEGRSTVDPFDDYLFFLARTPDEDYRRGEIETIQISLFLGGNYLVSCHRREAGPISTTSERAEQDPGRYLGRGMDLLAYQILDRSVDGYFPFLERIDDEIDRIEEEVFSEPDEELLAQISDIRSDLIALQRTVGPQREMAGKLARPELPFVQDERKIYFRDIQDNLARISDLLSNYRELIGGARDMYMTVISNEMNEIMQTLTIVATIFIPLTFIAGVYGMNFEIIPELGWDWGYFGALGVMGAMALGMLYYFRKKDWL